MSLVTDSHPVAARRFYKATLAGLTYRELWRLGSWWNATIATVMKRCGYDMVLSQGTPEPVRLEQMRVSPFALRGDIRGALDAMLSPISMMGFARPTYYRLPESLIAGNECAGAVCLHRDNQTFANLVVAQSFNKWRAVTSFVTAYTDGSFFSTGNDKARLIENPENGWRYLPGLHAPELFARHERARQRWEKGRQVRRVSTEAELASALFDYEQSSYQWHVRRGVYLEMSAAEIESARRQVTLADIPAANEQPDLNFHLSFVGEERPLKVPDRITFAGSVMVESFPPQTSAASTWLLQFSNPEGDTHMEMTIHGLLLEAAEGEVLKASLQRGSGSIGGPLLKSLGQLVGHQVKGYTPSVKQLNVRLTLVSRGSASSATDTRTAGEHLFQLEFPGTAGAFRFVIHPARCEGRLGPQADLDRSAAMLCWAGLLN